MLVPCNLWHLELRYAVVEVKAKIRGTRVAVGLGLHEDGAGSGGDSVRKTRLK
jgi:hypothetical protein